jgi:hypothetical protein
MGLLPIEWVKKEPKYSPLAGLPNKGIGKSKELSYTSLGHPRWARK